MAPMKKDVALRVLLAGLDDESLRDGLRAEVVARDQELARSFADELIARVRRNPERYPIPESEEPVR